MLSEISALLAVDIGDESAKDRVSRARELVSSRVVELADLLAEYGGAPKAYLSRRVKRPLSANWTWKRDLEEEEDEE